MRFGLLVGLISCFTMGYAQWAIGVLAEPSLNIASVRSSEQYNTDSVINLKRPDYTVSLGIEIRKQLDRYNAIFFSPSFMQANMLLVKENMQFLDIVHPQLPEIRDFGQTAEKKAFIRHRQFYAGLQIGYAKRLQVKLPDSKFFIETGGGLAGCFLVRDDVKVRTEAFALGNEYVHIIQDSTGTEVRPFQVNIFGFMDVNYTVKPDFMVIGGARLGIPLASTTTSDPIVSIFRLGMRVGFRYVL